MPMRASTKVLLWLSMISMLVTLVMLWMTRGNILVVIFIPMIVAALYAPNGMLSSMLSWVILVSGYLLLLAVLILDMYLIRCIARVVQGIMRGGNSRL
ncbi:MULTISPECIES: hypothetical protein [unclassified Paenibacillus]|uniref:Uncharacterized protein n=1 Tax=Paenibacillus provencensis TaxID=441151 RepID=A0ABW3PZB6_9BACL|nr:MULTISPECIES: hypothetical protein [unclassified Paenibacillus]MCM3128368.1 hypothetical protein [Paenibacillus sp. MER 78]SFS86269.1 hypothetical protein SAMN04488601_105159 [Paenibacillus sp. 453mf]